jgi:thioredoxin 1
MKFKKIVDNAVNVVLVILIGYIILSGKYMLYVGIVKSWFIESAPEQKIEWYETYQVARFDAREKDKNIAVLITAPDWCAPCKAMEQTTLQSKKLAEVLNTHFIPVKILDGSTEISQFEVESYPTFIIISQQGEIVAKKKGYLGVNELISLLNEHQ